MVAAAIRTIFAQPDAQHLHDQLDVIAGMLGRQSPQLEVMLRDAAEDLLALPASPRPLERSGPPTPWSGATGAQTPHRRRGRVPNPDALPRLAGAVLVKAHDNGKSATAASSRKAPWPPHRDPQGGDASSAHAGIDPPTPTGTAPRAYHAAGRHRGALRAIDSWARPRLICVGTPGQLPVRSTDGVALLLGGGDG
jgi:hypothetical protein